MGQLEAVVVAVVVAVVGSKKRKDEWTGSKFKHAAHPHRWIAAIIIYAKNCIGYVKVGFVFEFLSR
jgi:hypothetical protein